MSTFTRTEHIDTEHDLSRYNSTNGGFTSYSETDWKGLLEYSRYIESFSLREGMCYRDFLG